jgi:hypothetical protein
VVSESDVTGLGIRSGILEAGTERVVPSSNKIRYCGDVDGSNGISITVPACVDRDVGSTSSTRVPRGYSSLITAVSSQCNDTNRPPSYFVVG